ncbi:MAG: glucokinase [Burkholderiales bacterium]|nr:glucokinase [Burkholderiales bacterium]
MSWLLAADVGGTKTLVALAQEGGALPRIAVEWGCQSRDFSALEAILETFLARPEVAPHAGGIASTCLSVAGPVENGTTTLTNLGWRIEAAALAARLGLAPVALINDFAAAGLGIPALAAGDFVTLQQGEVREHATRLVIGAGTGLGTGWLVWNGERYVAHASEAGHADFAPLDEIQDELLAYLRRNFGRVSWERVVSGPGLMRIFSFLQEKGVGIPSREMLAASKASADTTAVIGEFGASRRDPLAVKALDIFVSAYGAFAGNVALATLARGGTYIAGGIAPRIIARLRDSSFIRAFNDKGRFGDLLKTIPVHVVMNPKVCLYGALIEANRLAAPGVPG